jgi:P pilus assembly chaperone PapD
VIRAAFCALLLLAASPRAVGAQVSVEVAPLRIELQAGPGSVANQAITVQNSGKEPLRVRARITDWDLARDGAPQFEGVPEGGPYSATAWVRVAPPELVVDPGKEGIVRFSLTVPQGIEPAGYRTGILFEFLPPGLDPGKKGRGEVQFRSRIASLIYVNVGTPPIAVELTDLLSRDTKEGLRVIAVLKNTSKRTVRTKGTLTLFDRAGATIAQLPIPDVPLLPEREREVAIPTSEGDKRLPAGEYRVELKIDVGMAAVIVGETTLKVPK